MHQILLFYGVLNLIFSVESQPHSCPTPNPRLQQLVTRLFDESSCEDIQELSLCPLTFYVQTAQEMRNCREKIANLDSIINATLGNCNPDLRDAFVWDMDKEFLRVVKNISDILNNQSDYMETLRVANYIKRDKRMSYRLWYRAMIDVMQNSPELSVLKVSEPLIAMPGLFVPQGVNVEKQYSQKDYVGTESCILVDETAGEENGDENLLFYFREDIGVNSHHSYWHAIHGWESENHEDRRGELFSYMHRSMLARYATERLTHCMVPLLPYRFKLGGFIDTGYKPLPHLGSNLKSNTTKWLARPNNYPLPEETKSHVPFTGVHGKACKFDRLELKTFIRHINNVERAIQDGFYFTNSSRVNLTIDLIGDIVEASTKPPKFSLLAFGSIHNLGHDIISKALDPMRAKASVGVMGDTATAMRDPIFYRWHAFVEELMDSYQRTLTPHTINGGQYPLKWEGVKISSIKTLAEGNCSKPNELNTFWSKTLFRVLQSANQEACSKSMLNVCVKHLDHEDFRFEIKFEGLFSQPVQGTVRIFLAPRNHQNGQRLTLLQQREFIFILDTFNTIINPGQNTLIRHANESTVTTSSERGGSFHCGCGWPAHLLLPKGTQEGMEFDLFVMVTNGSKYIFNHTDNPCSSCKQAPLFCGIPRRNAKYPDLDLPMGYPFDRLPYKVINADKNRIYVENLENYVKGVPNMLMDVIKITHRNIVIDGQGPWYTHPATHQKQNPDKNLCNPNYERAPCTPCANQCGC